MTQMQCFPWSQDAAEEEDEDEDEEEGDEE